MVKFMVNDRQCQQALTCINKSVLGLTYEDFEQMTLPQDIVLRNIVVNRYNQLQIQVGTMAKLYEIKSVSARKIARYFVKQVQFYRELLVRRQNFCSKYGGDIYTLSQALCKNKKTKITFNQFYQFARGYKFYFNENQFKAIFKRTKNTCIKTPYFYDQISNIQIQVQRLCECLLTTVKNLDIKNKMRIISGQSFEHLKQPSYKSVNVWTRQRNIKQQNKALERQQFVKQMRQNDLRDKHEISYKFYYPGMSFYSNNHRNQLREMHQKWNEEVHKMGNEEIDVRYSLIDHKHYFI